MVFLLISPKSWGVMRPLVFGQMYQKRLFLLDA